MISTLRELIETRGRLGAAMAVRDAGLPGKLGLSLVTAVVEMQLFNGGVSSISRSGICPQGQRGFQRQTQS